MTGRPLSKAWKVVALVALTIAVAGCTPVRVDGRDVNNTSWRAVLIAGHAPTIGAEPTLRFDFATVEGNAGCNEYVGQRQATVTEGRLDLGEILATTGGCLDANGRPAPGSELEPLFLAALGAADRIAFRGSQLVISGPSGEIVLEPDR